MDLNGSNATDEVWYRLDCYRFTITHVMPFVVTAKREIKTKYINQYISRISRHSLLVPEQLPGTCRPFPRPREKQF